ncbi:NAD(P)/FAD-dependent oxidoreductase [Ruminobacter sp.]|uniref:NAD(P)/FAD-dependent oxidoreductase n=1 Tax=Ruminobacter sp. TaxID=2774296 RepID=UPI0038683B53
MSFNIERNDKKRVVIIGGGFGGLRVAQGLRKSNFQVILVDKNNYHQFPPLIYQIATAGLNPSSISFPFRKLFEDRKDYYFRMAELTCIYPENNYIQTSIGKIDYDYLILANGTKTNFFNNGNVEEWAIPMKTVPEAMGLRNTLLASFERSVTCSSEQERDEFLNIVIVGGGPSGVEIAGAIAEMRRYVLPKDYPDMDTSRVHIHLIEGGKRLLAGMSEESSEKALNFLKKMNVEVKLNTFVTDYTDHSVRMNDGSSIGTRNLIWVGGVTANSVNGLPDSVLGRGRRIIVDNHNKVKGFENIFAIGDVAIMEGDPKYPNGHPQMAQPSIQQGTLLAKNIMAMEKGQPLTDFTYKDLGCMATIGKNKAVAEIAGCKFGGFIAWILWMAVHLVSILGVKNKFFVFMDWIWSYFTYDQSNRMILRSTQSKVMKNIEDTLRELHGHEDGKASASGEEQKSAPKA